MTSCCASTAGRRQARNRVSWTTSSARLRSPPVRCSTNPHNAAACSSCSAFNKAASSTFRDLLVARPRGAAAHRPPRPPPFRTPPRTRCQNARPPGGKGSTPVHPRAGGSGSHACQTSGTHCQTSGTHGRPRGHTWVVMGNYLTEPDRDRSEPPAGGRDASRQHPEVRVPVHRTPAVRGGRGGLDPPYLFQERSAGPHRGRAGVPGGRGRPRRSGRALPAASIPAVARHLERSPRVVWTAG